uniref:AlNc14C15G1669 protein n=1 Tax=Albugo laibachii Nc14 TaxID=890382 RepID=F0W3W8_9STRA|nr:AlNc14C15G1669 [Albugo laibachii Nc14]|eukprot:CCA15763.1 AlNc14C15G1669 [Albugo laibachii Nc14]
MQCEDSEVSEERWPQHILKAKNCDMTRFAALNKAMEELKMKTNMDGGSRVDTLVQELMDILNDLSMENFKNFDQDASKVFVKYLIPALFPAVFKKTVENEITLQRNERYRSDVPACVGWLREYAISFQRFEGPMIKDGMVKKTPF